MTPRTLLTAALGCAAVLSVGCYAPDDTPSTETTATETRVAPLETYRADATPHSSARLFLGSFIGPVLPTGVHQGYVEDFLQQPNFGHGRMTRFPQSPRPYWTELVAVSADGDHTGGVNHYDPVTETLTLTDGSQLARRERVWLLKDHQLVGLMAESGPVVYQNSPKSQHEAMKAKTDGATVPKRSPDGFETEALEKLRAGDEVALRSSDGELRMLGAIRARKDCQSCHKVEVGTLLGAFTYTLKLQSEETPAEHKLTDLAGLTERQQWAVKSIEAVGGKVIRTPGGPVTEVKMSFAYNPTLGSPAVYVTRLQLRDSSLPHLLAFPDLTTLDVSNSLVSDAGLKTLAELKNLKKLDAQHTSTTAAGVAELKKALPECEVITSPPPPAPRPR